MDIGLLELVPLPLSFPSVAEAEKGVSRKREDK